MGDSAGIDPVNKICDMTWANLEQQHRLVGEGITDQELIPIDSDAVVRSSSSFSLGCQEDTVGG